jgi:hypothetical protein
MSSPADEQQNGTNAQSSQHISSSQGLAGSQEQPSLPSYNINQPQRTSYEKLSDEDGTMVGGSEHSHGNQEDLATRRNRANSHLTIHSEYDYGDPLRSVASPSQAREQSHRMNDDLEMLKIERQVSKQNEDR